MTGCVYMFYIGVGVGVGVGVNELSLLAKPSYLNDENHEMIQLTSSYGKQKKNTSLTS